MKHTLKKWLSVLLAVCLLMALAPSALMEDAAEAQEEVAEIEATESGEMQEAEPVAEEEATEPEEDSEPLQEEEPEFDEDVAIDPVDEMVGEQEDVDLGDLFEDDALDEALSLDIAPETQSVETVAANGALMAASSNFDVLSNNTTFTVQGKTISASQVGNQNNCWTYARYIYQKIWGTLFLSDFTGSASEGWNSLRQLSDADRTLTVDHLKAYVGNAQLGATIRICGCTSGCSAWGNDGLSCGHKGHNVIIVQKDANGFTTVENAYPAGKSSYEVCTRYYSWQGFVNWWGPYGCAYIKYIKWPNAAAYNNYPELTNRIVFNPEYYYHIHKDLQKAYGYNVDALKEHFINHGIYEGRSASPVFDILYYLDKNPDLKKNYSNNYPEAVKHFVNHGIQEGRWASAEFTIQLYKANYRDLQKIYGDDNYRYYEHYAYFGWKEKRTANKRISVKFDGNGGTPSASELIVTEGDPYKNLPTAERKGYTFNGWYTQKTGGEQMKNNTIVDYYNHPVLYAHWKETITPAPADNPTKPSDTATILTIPAVKNTSKTTISAAPGTMYRLDLGSATGKSFKSSKKKVAVVDQSGNVAVMGAGKTKITFKVGKKKRTVTLTVKDPTIPTRVSLNLSGTVAANVGQSQTLTATLPTGTTSGIKWTSSNKKVATVSGGVVTFKKKGKVTITATATRGKKKAKVKFVVSK